MADSNVSNNKFATSKGLWFVIVFLIFAVVAILVMMQSNRNFLQSYQALCQTYTNHIDFVESKSMLTREVYNHDDSIQVSRNADASLIEECQNVLTEINIAQQHMLTHLQLHLDKVDRGYTSLEIWAATLTLIFLVFSFYALFKMDDFIRQGADSVKEIRELKKEGDEYLRDTKMMIDSNREIISKDLNESKTSFQKNAEDSLQQIIEQYNKVNESLEITLRQCEDQRKRLVTSVNLFDKDRIQLIDESKKEFSEATSNYKKQIKVIIDLLSEHQAEVKKINNADQTLIDEENHG